MESSCSTRTVIRFCRISEFILKLLRGKVAGFSTTVTYQICLLPFLLTCVNGFVKFYLNYSHCYSQDFSNSQLQSKSLGVLFAGKSVTIPAVLAFSRCRTVKKLIRTLRSGKSKSLLRLLKLPVEMEQA